MRVTFLKVQPIGGGARQDPCNKRYPGCLGQQTHETITGLTEPIRDGRRSESEIHRGCLPCCKALAKDALEVLVA